MTSERTPILAALRAAFTTALTSGEVDVVENAAAGEVEVIADDWTLHLEGWPLTAAWFALDDDPASPAEQRAALSRRCAHVLPGVVRRSPLHHPGHAAPGVIGFDRHCLHGAK